MIDLNMADILETIHMIDEENLDIRTITMGISLLDCADSDIDRACDRIYEKIVRKAANLVRTGEDIEREYGIPIINKRISVTPISMILAASGGDPVKYALTLERAAKEVGANYLGGYSALVQKGFAAGDEALIRSIPEALTVTDHVCSSVNIGSTKAGINMDAVALMGQIIRECAEKTADRECIAASKLVVFCNAVEDNPFMAGAFHGAGEPDCVINVGVSGPGVVRHALKKIPDANITEVAKLVKNTAFKITRVGQLVANEASRRLDVPFGIVDLSLAPTPAVGDSVAHVLEEMGLEQCGCAGTTACLALLNDAVKKGGVMASSHVGGLSGAFIPVSEDAGMIDAAKSGCLTIEKLEAMTAAYEAKEWIEAMHEGRKMTTSCCPAFISLLRHQFPKQYEENKSSTVSPMVAVNRYLKAVHPGCVTVFIGPCIAKKGETLNSFTLEPVEEPYQESSLYGKKFASSGGVAAAVLEAMKEMGEDTSGVKLLTCAGGEECRRALMLLKSGRLEEDFVEGMMCPGGCVGGPSRQMAEAELTRSRTGLLGKADGRSILDNLKNYPMDSFSMYRDGHMEAKNEPVEKNG